MPPSPDWRSLLAGADSIQRLAAVGRALGFGDPAPLVGEIRQTLGIPEAFSEAAVADGRGTLRLLLLVTADPSALRHQLQGLAARLATHAPHYLWIALVASASRPEVAVSTWTAAAHRPRVAALFVDRARVLGADVDTMAAVAAASGGTDVLAHTRWQEVLGRESISLRFYRALERRVLRLAESGAGDVREGDRTEIALLTTSRLLFLAFLESKGWLDGDHAFLSRIFDDCMSKGGGFHRRVLWPLFFGTLNTRAAKRSATARRFGRIPFLNGGLFQRSAAERRARQFVVDDGEWGAFYDELLQRYRFSAREDVATWSEVAIDPEMLGRAFESLMASRDRRNSGAYFTPQPLVERVTEAALESLLEGAGLSSDQVQRLLRGAPVSDDAGVIARILRSLRLLDPACGSGAFLVHAQERLTAMRRASGDDRPAHLIRREVLTRNIFGVDVNPTAVWLCELRLWLAMVIDQEEADPARVVPLPNLDHHVRCGDALLGGDFSLAPAGRGGARLVKLRSRYSRATGTRKRTLGRALDREERAHSRALLEARLDLLSMERRALVVAARGRDLFGERRGAVASEREALQSLRTRSREIRAAIKTLANGGAVPFAFAAQFPDALASGGFDVVIGNPPWVRLHRIPPLLRARFGREFLVFREAAWDAGARAARAGRGFSAQVDLASLFVERGLALTRPAGVLSLLIPAKLWRSLAGGGVRRLLHDRHQLRVLEDWSDAPAAFDAAVYPALVVARKSPLDEQAARSDVTVATHRRQLAISWRTPQQSLPLDESPGAPWLVLPPEARHAFDRLQRSAVPLVESGIGRPTLGVKCGCNDAFLVTEVARRRDVVTVRNGTREAVIEASSLRPLLRGESCQPWRAAEKSERIIYTCDDEGRPWRALPAGARDWLVPHRRQLMQRSDIRHGKAWWSLFRTEGASHDRPRVVWADVARSPQALVLRAGDRTVPLNTCYVVRCRDVEDAFALAALLNSALAAAWLGALAEPARGGYRRFLAWTVARLPIPDDWARARPLLAPFGEAGYDGRPLSRQELLEAVIDAYRVRRATMAPLLEWTSH